MFLRYNKRKHLNKKSKKFFLYFNKQTSSLSKAILYFTEVHVYYTDCFFFNKITIAQTSYLNVVFGYKEVNLFTLSILLHLSYADSLSNTIH